MKRRGTGLSSPSLVRLWCFVCLVALAAPAAAEPTGPRVHVVSPGDTLGKLADRYGVSLEALQRVNRLAERLLRAPQFARCARKAAVLDDRDEIAQLPQIH